jgi:transcriptional regulator with XRE-family HTH domain
MLGTFGKQLQEWRKEAGISQADLAAALGKTPGWVSQVERGTRPNGTGKVNGIAPPDKQACDVIGTALGRPDGEVWALAAPERIEAYDPDLGEFHREALANAAARLEEEDRALLRLGAAARSLAEVLYRHRVAKSRRSR